MISCKPDHAGRSFTLSTSVLGSGVLRSFWFDWILASCFLTSPWPVVLCRAPTRSFSSTLPVSRMATIVKQEYDWLGGWSEFYVLADLSGWVLDQRFTCATQYGWRATLYKKWRKLETGSRIPHSSIKWLPLLNLRRERAGEMEENAKCQDGGEKAVEFYFKVE